MRFEVCHKVVDDEQHFYIAFYPAGDVTWEVQKNMSKKCWNYLGVTVEQDMKFDQLSSFMRAKFNGHFAGLEGGEALMLSTSLEPIKWLNAADAKYKIVDSQWAICGRQEHPTIEVVIEDMDTALLFKLTFC